jgi:hypothetical protein
MQHKLLSANEHLANFIFSFFVLKLSDVVDYLFASEVHVSFVV